MKGILFINKSCPKCREVLHGMDGQAIPFDLETVIIQSKSDPAIRKYEVPGVPFLLLENGMKLRGAACILEYMGVNKTNGLYEPFQNETLSDVQNAWYQKMIGSANTQPICTKSGSNDKDFKKTMEQFVKQRESQIPKPAARS